MTGTWISVKRAQKTGFIMKKKNIYMDNNATTPLHPEVRKAMVEAVEVYGNPSSLHWFGRKAKGMIESSRGKVAGLIGASSDEMIFVGSGSEANNTVLSIFSCHPKACDGCRQGRNEIVTTSIEHPCVMETSKCLEMKGTPVKYLKVDRYGKVDMESFKGALGNKTGLVSVMMANNEIGTTQNIKAMAEIAHEKGALFHTDAVQAAGKMPVDVKDLDVDFLTISAHKIYGPKGIGALYIKKGVPFCPMIRGGHQEMGRRAGTENTMGIVGFGKAAEMRIAEMEDEEKRLLAIKMKIKRGIENEVPEVVFNGHPEDCLPGTLNVSFAGAEGESVLLALDLEGISVSTGSACASGALDPSHVLLATGLDVALAHDSIRVSLGRENTEEEAERLIATIAEVVGRIRRISTIPTKKYV
jgi:cysteine desulfurase